ncbi:mediator of RNA polymerase II transcription subunit 15-like [Galendromus occidentalis]|uniref:Mediator of RNA polymerase II transcription subunit 15 n=1 Tax=Galendromus occidentalis TaxID=34638 RepID=A0AAJ7PBL3_9ACAR|nr:mediator of RNA polymerase II transcription subunit 15-like [Galendromus occidentalis]
MHASGVLPDNCWTSTAARHVICMRTQEALTGKPTPLTLCAIEIEAQAFCRSRTKEEYYDLLSEFLNHIRKSGDLRQAAEKLATMRGNGPLLAPHLIYGQQLRPKDLSQDPLPASRGALRPTAVQRPTQHIVWTQRPWGPVPAQPMSQPPLFAVPRNERPLPPLLRAPRHQAQPMSQPAPSATPRDERPLPPLLRTPEQQLSCFPMRMPFRPCSVAIPTRGAVPTYPEHAVSYRKTPKSMSYAHYRLRGTAPSSVGESAKENGSTQGQNGAPPLVSPPIAPIESEEAPASDPPVGGGDDRTAGDSPVVGGDDRTAGDPRVGGGGNQSAGDPRFGGGGDRTAGGTPATCSAEDQERSERLECLSQYVEPVKKLISIAEKDERNKDYLWKLNSLLEVLTNPDRRYSIDTLIKCQQVCEHLDFRMCEPGQAPKYHIPSLTSMMRSQDDGLWQPLLDAINANIKSPMFNHTLQEVFGRPIAVMLPSEYSDSEPSSPPAKMRRCTSPAADGTCELPELLAIEILQLDPQFKASLVQPLDDKSIKLFCQLDINTLPSVPAVTVAVPENYPQSAPSCLTDQTLYRSSEFHLSLLEALKARMAEMPPRFTVTELLDAWEMCVRKTFENMQPRLQSPGESDADHLVALQRNYENLCGLTDAAGAAVKSYWFIAKVQVGCKYLHFYLDLSEENRGRVYSSSDAYGVSRPYADNFIAFLERLFADFNQFHRLNGDIIEEKDLPTSSEPEEIITENACTNVPLAEASIPEPSEPDLRPAPARGLRIVFKEIVTPGVEEFLRELEECDNPNIDDMLASDDEDDQYADEE